MKNATRYRMSKPSGYTIKRMCRKSLRELKIKMAANLSKTSEMGSCMNGHLNKGDTSMPEQPACTDKVVILDAGAQYGKV